MKKLESKVAIEITNINEYKNRLDNLKNLLEEVSSTIESINNFEFTYSILDQHQPDYDNEDKY